MVTTMPLETCSNNVNMNSKLANKSIHRFLLIFSSTMSNEASSHVPVSSEPAHIISTPLNSALDNDLSTLVTKEPRVSPAARVSRLHLPLSRLLQTDLPAEQQSLSPSMSKERELQHQVWELNELLQENEIMVQRLREQDSVRFVTL